MVKIEGIRAIGFDLDGTLYKSIPEMDDRIRTRISEHILEKHKTLGTVAAARRLFEDHYRVLQGGGSVLKRLGFENSDVVMEESLATANICDLIHPNPELSGTMRTLGDQFELYLLTSSPRKRAEDILDRIGLEEGMFTQRVFSDSGVGEKRTGDAFRYVLSRSTVPTSAHLYIGDREKSDILPAKSVGMKSASVWKRIASADYYFAAINDIKGLVA